MMSTGSDFRAANEGRMRSAFTAPSAAVADQTGESPRSMAARRRVLLRSGACLRSALGTAQARWRGVHQRGPMPDGGGTFLLPRIIGLGRALELMFLGDTDRSGGAAPGRSWNCIVADEAEAVAYAGRIAAGPPLVLNEVKRAVWPPVLKSDLRCGFGSRGRRPDAAPVLRRLCRRVTAFSPSARRSSRQAAALPASADVQPPAERDGSRRSAAIKSPAKNLWLSGARAP